MSHFLQLREGVAYVTHTAVEKGKYCIVLLLLSGVPFVGVHFCLPCS